MSEVETQHRQAMDTIVREREAEKVAHEEQVTQLTLQVNTAKDQLTVTEQERASKNDAYEEVKVKVSAMEELNNNLT